ncbi:hypothetical protein FHW71_002555 [Enterobacter sp. Sphag1F]|nr:hypothetical protein [Enterobacter sp. Sphag1F]NYI14648.1 hypothetical protein [Enterobacter sp. Sphag71]
MTVPERVFRRVRIHAHQATMNGDPTELVTIVSQKIALLLQRGC